MEPNECLRVACYNQRNGRECWTAEHRNGTRTFEHPSRAAAAAAAQLPSDHATLRLNSYATC
jgi:hypothetical protein